MKAIITNLHLGTKMTDTQYKSLHKNYLLTQFFGKLNWVNLQIVTQL